MAGNVIECYRRWFEYERDAHSKTFASLESVPINRRSAPEFQRAACIIAHIVAARRMWLARLGIITSAPGALFPENADVGQVAAQWREVERLWSGYLAALDDAVLSREFEYQSLDAGRFRNRVEDILTQLFGHSWYHRGQIAMLVRAAGGQPAVTDLIYWCREPAGDAGR